MDEKISSSNFAYMSDAKWEKLFLHLCDISILEDFQKLVVFLKKLGGNDYVHNHIDLEHNHYAVLDKSLTNQMTSWGVLYRHIEFIEFPKSYKQFLNKYNQNLEKIKLEIEKIGIFEIEIEEKYLRIYGYKYKK
jgi:hypothetical protein